MLGKDVQRQLEVEEQQTRTGPVGGGASHQLKFPTHKLFPPALDKFPTFNSKIMSGGNGGKFLYFAFGSNLLRERLHISNPSAVFK